MAVLDLLQPRELRVLESLRLHPSRSYRGATRGERVSRKKGVSIEFADYRNYTEGDDLRHLDWNVLARLDTPVMRTYQDEEDLLVYLTLDASQSMLFGNPTKYEIAQKYAAALGYVGLLGGDGVRTSLVGGRQAPTSAMRGRASAYRLMSWVSQEAPNESLESLNQTLQTLLRSNYRTGLAIIVSDGLDPEIPGTIRALGGRGFEVWVVQILSDVEIDPDLEGDLRLTDAENQSRIDITINRDTVGIYKANLQRHVAEIQTACLKSSGKHLVVRTSETLEDVIQKRMKPAGWFE
jgi:uncharacterized protein (DUF58 family)